MSAQFILEYGGLPMNFAARGTPCGMTLAKADVFTSEAEAWLSAHHFKLAPELCRVVPLAARSVSQGHQLNNQP